MENKKNFAEGSTLTIRKADPSEHQAVRAFYHSLIDAVEGKKRYFKWQKEIYPASEDIKAAVDAQTLYIGLAGSRIAASMVVNHKCNEEYRDVAWPEPLPKEEYVVIHMLGVHSDFAGMGFGRQMVQYAIRLARETGNKAVRLDMLKGNLPAQHLYDGLGFHYVDSLKLYYENTGRTDFDFYEYRL